MTIFFSIVFFAYGGAIIKGRDYFFDYVKNECEKPLNSFGDYDRIHTIAETFICTDVCPCKAGITYTILFHL